MRARVRGFRPTPLLLFCFSSTSAYAQTVELRLLEESGSTSIAGAIVRLLDGSNSLAQGLTDEQGRLVLRAPAPGTYRLKIDRIGWTGIVSDPFPLVQGETLRQEIRMASRRVLLPELIVSGKSTCDRDAQGGSLAFVLWDEVRKALTANLLTQRAKSVPVHLREFVREVGLDGRPRREWVVSSTISHGGRFGALAASELTRNGFVQQSGDSVLFAAPEAATLLADEFVASHCFRAVASTNRLAGLSFEPVRGRRVPDVSGTLWLERETGELRSLEYSYTGLQDPMRDPRLGGALEFWRLPGGQWIVHYWHVRMPVIQSPPVGLGDAAKPWLAGYLDRGGRAELAGDIHGRVDLAIVRGRVYDSTIGRGLAGAMVAVAGTATSVLADGEGRFELAVRGSGDHVVTASHAKLGLIGETTSRKVLLSLGDTTTVQFAVPPLGRFVKALCDNRASTVSIVGLTWNARGARAAQREVQALKQSARGNLPKETPARSSRPIRSNAKGLFAVCSLPPNDTVRLIAVDFAKVLAEVLVALEGQSRWVDLRDWGSSDTTIVPLKLPGPVAAEPKPPKGVGFEGFEARRRIGRGKFLDSTDLRRNQHQYLDGVLNSIAGVTVVPPRPCGPGQLSDCVADRTMRVALSGRQLASDRCFLQVVVDGVVLGRGGTHRWEDGFDLSRLGVSELRAVEVYRGGAEVPTEFNDAGAECGVLVLWTKRPIPSDRSSR
jgi:hypothetical protein